MRALAAITLAALCVSQSAAQQPSPTFRAGIDVLTVEASVLDGRGAPIADLKPEDFAVTINGKARRVRHARLHEVAGSETLSAGSTSSSVPGAVSNVSGTGRIVVFVVDRDSIAPGSEKALFESASMLVDGLGAGDAAGVLELPGAATDLTRDRDRVRNALLRVVGARPASMMPRDYQLSYEESLAYERGDKPTIQRVVERECYAFKTPPGLRDLCPDDLITLAMEMRQTGRMRTQTVLSNLSSLAAQLTPLKGSKQIVLLSSGFPWGQDLLPLYDRFTRQAAAAQILFHAIHVGEPGADVAARRNVSSAFGGSDYMTGMANIASETGGAFLMASGSGEGIFERMRTALNNYYELGVEFEPADVAREKIIVDVKVARSGATVRHRRHVSPPATGVVATAERLSEMLKQPTDVAELPVAVSAFTLRGDEPATLRTLVALEAGTAGDPGPAEWGFSAFKEGNVVAMGRQRLEGGAGPWAAALSAKLLPGRYRLRAAVVDSSGRAGVLERDIDVGLRGNSTAQFSDLLTGVADANGRLQPTSRIRKGSPLSLLMEVVSADAATLEQVKTVLEIIPGGTATPIKKFVMGARSGTASAILNNQAEVPTTDMPVGRYTAIATPSIGDQPIGKVTRIFEIIEPVKP